MSSIDNLHLFLRNYLHTKNISWLELFIFEFYQRKKQSKELLLSSIQGNEKFMALSLHMSYHLLKLLFSTICELMTTNDADKDAVLILRNFLTNGLGSRIITMMSADLDLSGVTNERELVVVLTKIFPSESWESLDDTAHLQPLTQSDYKRLYKRLWLLDPTNTNDTEPESLRQRSRFVITEVDEGETKSCEEFFTEEFNNRHETMQLSSSQMAQKVVEILKKLLAVENASVLGQTDQNSVTMSCLNFSLDTLSHLDNQNVFTDDDQTVIKASLLELTFLCFNNLVNRDGKSIEPVFKKLFHLLEVTDSAEVSCGLILNILTILNNLCVKSSIQKSDNLKMFDLCNHLITRRMEILGRAGEFLHIIQILLIKIVKNVRISHEMRVCEKKKSRRRRRRDDFIAHHDSTCDACTFEKLLIDSCQFIRRYTDLKPILSYFRAKDICCCNGSIDTIKVLMKPSTVPAQLLSIVQRKIIKPMFDKSKICVFCSDKISSEVFQGEYFHLLRSELYRRQGWELHTLLHHLTAVQRQFTGNFLHNFVFKVVVPVFQNKKVKFLQNPEENFEAKLIATSCLEILNDCVKEDSILNQFFTASMIQHIKDCSLIPAMASHACELIKTASDNIKTLGDNEDDRENIAKQINNILFTNVLYLTHELMEIYDQIDLPKDVPITPKDAIEKPGDKSREEAFEILDETAVAVKEPLSDHDVLLLNTIHWNIVCDLITKDPAFQVEFVANIFNNFSGNILFTIAYNALNSILLKKELKNFQLRVVSREPKMSREDLPVIFERCELRTPVLVLKLDLDFGKILERCYRLYEINESELDKLQTCEEFSKIFRVTRDNGSQFHTYVHKNIFLTDNVCDDPSRRQQIVGDHVVSYHNWLNQIWIGIFEGQSTIRNRFIQVINRLVRTDEEIKAIHRLNLIKDITDKRGVKFLSSIARNCFDICWRLSDNISFTAKMSTALEELKLLLLQDSWDENKEAMVDALQLLLGVAEMKASGVSRMMFMDPENQLSGSSESMFSDFSSSLERVTFEERSDGERFSDRKTESYYTADENYDGDGELCSNADTDLSRSFQTCSLPATLGFRNTNEHICKLVVEILMDLSKRCVEKPDQWQPNILIPLAQRLSCMKSYLGGSEFLIKGFSTVLQSRNVELIALQKTVLELIEDLNTTDAFKAFLSVLTVDEAAIDLIMARFESLCNSEVIPRPFIKINYPTVTSEATVTSNCDTHLHRLIQSFRDVHLSNKLLTPFTEASQIIPLNFLDFKPWNSQGFTVSAWIELPAGENTSKSAHLVALGSEKLMMAFYINSDGSFSINVMKPNQNFSDTSKFHKTLVAGTSANKENVNKTNIFGIALATLKDSDLPNVRTRGFLKKRVSATEEESTRRLKTSKISVKSKRVKVKVDKWTQVCFSARCSENEIMLLITINGTEQELIEIPIEGMRESEINGKLQLLCVGSQKQTKADALQYSISNVMLFRWPLDSPSQTSHLYSLGPDCNSLIDCEALEVKPLLGQVDFTKVTRLVTNAGSEENSLKLKGSVLVVYSAGGAISYNSSNHGKPMEIFTIGKIPSSISVPSLARSIQFCGGLSTLLILFARTIEMTEDPATQSSALYVLLKMSYENNHLFAEFEQKNLFNLVAHVFKHSSCYRGPGMLKAILDVIYGGTMFNRKSKTDDFQVNERSVLNIEHPKLLLKLLENFDIFISPEKNESHILDVLFKSLMVVVQESHPHRRLNRQCLIDHDFYAKLIEFCKTHLANSSNAIAITPKTALVIVELLKMLSKNQPVMWTMNEIQKLLLLLHHPSESFVTHDRTKFHFILPGHKPTKSSKPSLNSSKSTKYFNFSTKIRSTSAANAPTSPSSPPRTPRTPSDSTSMPPDMSGSTRSLKSTVATTPTRKVSARKFDELNEIQTQTISKALADVKIRKDLKTPSKLRLRRLQHTPKRSPYKKLKVPEKTKIKLVAGTDSEDQHLAETFQDLMTASTAPSVVSDVDSSRYETGVSVLQENLFEILRDFVIMLDDTKAEFDLPDCLKMEILIMFANHHDPNVRAAIIELIEAVTLRESPDLVAKFEKSNFWVHLGNQLTITSVNMRMAQACVDWICFEKICIQEMSRSQKIRVKYKPAFNVLIAMLPTMVHDHAVMSCTTRFFRVLLETQPDYLGTQLIAALITSAIKALMKLDRKHERVKDSILMLLEQIASRSLTSSGSIQPLWDILYGLAFVEKQKKREVIREVHVTILKQLIALCLTEQSRRGSRAGNAFYQQLVVTQNLGTLPATEIKTRFNLIHDRAVHFVSSWDASEELAACEADFVKYLIDLHFFGIHQGSSIILWALNPAGDVEIKSFVVQKLSNVLGIDGNFVIPGNDTKLIKSLLLQYLNDHSKDISEEILKNITKFCGVAVSQQSMTWSWSMSAVEKIDLMRQSSQKDQNSHIEKIVYKLEPLVQSCIESAMKMTRSVIDVQNKERRLLMNQLKKSQEIDFYREWFEVIQRMVHEDAPWYSSDLYPSTWELDETEGPGRTRIRLKRSVLKIDEKFFMDDFKQKASFQHRKPLLNYLLRPKETEKYSIRDRIVFTFNAKHLTMELEIEGEVIVTDSQLIFLANTDTYINSIICDLKNIHEIWDRRYQHKEVAMEIFLSTRTTFFIIFETNYERDIVKKFVSDKIARKVSTKPEEALQKWVDGRFTSYEYLIELNKIGGRSYNDLMQYPVFPWILTDYQSDFLDLKKQETFRKLNKTISTQYEDMEEHYVTNYKYLAQSIADQPSVMKPYHYSSHYSNSGSILHFLVRLPPYTNMFLLYQDHNFDIPDRTFHSLATTYRLTSKESATDVKELIPEFFFMFDFFENSEGFNYGKRQSGDLVNDVKLPAWCDGSARLFMLIHRQALESDLVRKQLHHWIDLIFGYKQKGNAAVNAVNVFHPATYPEFQITNITDAVERSAYETMIRTYGQMPKQIFTSSHKKSSFNNDSANESWPVMKTVKGLRWGSYTGSPALLKPGKIDSLECGPRIAKFVLIDDQNMFYGLPEKCHLMRATKNENQDLVLWSESDGVIRVKSLKDSKERTRKLFHISPIDPVTACGSHVKHSSIWFGHESGNISVYTRTDEKSPEKPPKKSTSRNFNDALEAIIGISEVANASDADDESPAISKWNFPIVLVKHRGEILDLKICVEFQIVVSIGVDGRTAIWDAQKIEYIRTIEPSCNTLKSQLTLVEVSPTLGDILTVFTPRNAIDAASDEENFEVTDNSADDFISVSMAIAGKSQLRLHTINAKYINHAIVDGFISSACFSFIKEGTGVNVIAVGFGNGTIKLYSTWTLELIREIATGKHCEISEIIYTTHQHLTFLADQEIQVWESEGLSGDPPKFNSIVLY